MELGPQKRFLPFTVRKVRHMKAKWLAQGHCSPSKRWRDRVHSGLVCPSANTGHHAAAVAFLWAQTGEVPALPLAAELPSFTLGAGPGLRLWGWGTPPAWHWGRLPGHPTLEGLPHSLLDRASLVVDTMLLAALHHLCL